MPPSCPNRSAHTQHEACQPCSLPARTTLEGSHTRTHFLPALSMSPAATTVPSTLVAPTAALARAPDWMPAFSNTALEAPRSRQCRDGGAHAKNLHAVPHGPVGHCPSLASQPSPSSHTRSTATHMHMQHSQAHAAQPSTCSAATAKHMHMHMQTATHMHMQHSHSHCTL